MDAALKKMFTFRQTRELELAALKDSGFGHRDSREAAGALGNYFFSWGIEPGYKAATEPCSLAQAYLAVGKRAEGENILRDLERESKSAFVSPYLLATIYAGLGQKDRAFEFLEKAYLERALDLTWFLKADPRVDSLRSDPRFQTLLHRVGLSA
jgi:hypothetical protein